MEAGRASVIIILELVTAVASALWIGGERMSVTEMVGGALILNCRGDRGAARGLINLSIIRIDWHIPQLTAYGQMQPLTTLTPNKLK